MNTVYLICFVLGLVLSLLAAFSGLGHLHFGHVRLHGGPIHTHTRVGARAGAGLSALNGFTLPAFLCWFGGAGYLLANYSPLISPLVLAGAVLAGLAGAGVLYIALFKLLLPRERVLRAEDTRMDGVVGRVSDDVRANGGIGEIIFTQIGARRSAPARSESGEPIPRGTEVVVLRFERGIASVQPLHELAAEIVSPALHHNR
jgi:membrane protein implicated in regulation of membrane protease activity